MPAEPPPNTGSDPGAGSSAAAPRGSVPTEAEIDSPRPLALRLLGVVFLLTLLPWAAAKVACNLKDSPIRPPRDLELGVIKARPKSAALELAHRMAGGQYRAAAELATGAFADQLLEQSERCDRQPASCDEPRRDADRIHTRATVTSRLRDRATVRAESHGPSGVQVENLALERRGREWLVVGRASALSDASQGDAGVVDAGP